MSNRLRIIIASFLAISTSCLSKFVGVDRNPIFQPPRSGKQNEFRLNTTTHLVFNTVASLLQHWPNTIHRNGHTFVPGILPLGTPLYHGRFDYKLPPSPEFFAFEIDHAYMFAFGDRSVILTYVANRDLNVGYFDGTGAAWLRGPRDLQEILVNDRFTQPHEYNPWAHADLLCAWGRNVSLDGFVRMEPSFEVIVCNIDSALELVSEVKLSRPEIPLLARPPAHPNPNLSDVSHQNYATNSSEFGPRLRSPIFMEPTIPKLPPSAGWRGKARTPFDVSFEAIRAGMWHNHWPGEARLRLDYSRIVSAYNEEYTSLVESRRGHSHVQHRLNKISANDKDRLRLEVNDVLTRERYQPAVNWASLFQAVLDSFSERLEDLHYILRRSDKASSDIASISRQRVLVMLSPYMVFPRTKAAINPTSSDERVVGERVSFVELEPDSDWIKRIYQACAAHATIGLLDRERLTKQEKLLAQSIEGVQAEICFTLTSIWSTAFDAESKPLLASSLVEEWKTQVEELMKWLGWHTWVKCDPPCDHGLSCTLSTWPWEVTDDDQVAVPSCRDQVVMQ